MKLMKFASDYLASTSQAEVVDLDDLLLIVSSAEGFHKVPDGFNYKEFIGSLKAGDQTNGPEQSQNLTRNVNDIFTSLMQPDLLSKTSMFISVQWNRLFALIRKQVSENTERKVKRKDFTCCRLASCVTIKGIRKRIWRVTWCSCCLV